MEDKSVSRRDFLKIAGVAGATVGLGAGLGGLVAACGGTEETSTTATAQATTTTTVADHDHDRGSHHDRQRRPRGRPRHHPGPGLTEHRPARLFRQGRRLVGRFRA